MAKIMVEGLHDPERAVRLYQDALSTDPTYVPAVYGIAAVYEKQGNWDELAESYRQFLNKLPQDQRTLGVPVHLSLGNLYLEKLSDKAHAIEEFQKLLVLDPDHVGAHAALANIKAGDPNLQEEAVREHIFLLRREPLRVASYRELFKIFQARDNTDRAWRTCRALAWLENPTPEEQTFLKGVTPFKVQELDPEAMSTYGIGRSGVYRDIVTITGEHMSKVYPVDMEQKYGLKKKDRLTGKEPGVLQLWQNAEKVRRVLRMLELDVYVLPKKTYRIHLENTQPPTVIVSQSLLELSDIELQFVLAKHLFYVAQKQTLTVALEETDLKRFFRVLQKSFAGKDVSAISTAEDEALLKNINWYLPKKSRKILEDRPEIWRETGKDELIAYLRQMELASNRCGLLVTDSLETAVQMVYRLTVLQKSGKWIPTGKIPPQEAGKVDAVSDLLLYNVSEEFGKLRQAARVAL